MGLEFRAKSMPINRNSPLWWLLVPLAGLLGVGAAIWFRTGAPATVNVDFGTLTDARGRPGDAADFAGKYLLVSFGYTSCPDICPLTLAGVHTALKNLGNAASELIPVFVSVDPKRDTPERLAVYVQSFDSRIRGFTGSATAIASTAAAFHVEYHAQLMASDTAYTVDHTALLFLVDPKRRIVAKIPEGIPANALALQITREFNDARHQPASKHLE